MMFTFETRREVYNSWIETAKVTRPNAADRAAELVEQGKSRYQKVEALSGVPWLWIASVHYRESSCDFRGVLHNGQHIIGTGQKTSIEPKGRGPFSDWESAAIDALTLQGLVNTGIDWSDDSMWFFQWERFNGDGYFLNGLRTPYILAGTSLQQPGLYDSDGHLVPTESDPRLGCWPVVLACRENQGYKSAPPVAGGPDILGAIKKSVGTGTAAGAIALATQIKDFATDWRTLATLAVGGALYVALQAVENQNATAYREGRLIPKPEIGDFTDADPTSPAV